MPNQNFRTKTSPLIVSFCEEEVTNILDAKRDAQNENKYVVTSLSMHTLSSSPFFFWSEFFDTCTPCCFAFQALWGFGDEKGLAATITGGGELTAQLLPFLEIL